MRTYIAFYKNNKVVVQANSSYEAQQKAAVMLKARKSYDVSVYLADDPVSTSSIG